jgi:drug/metabolite transporter (DMT)-like permease
MVGTFFYAILSGQLSFQFEPTGWVWASLFAVVSTVLAIMFLWWGIGLLDPSRATIIGALEPFLSILLSVLILGERRHPGARQPEGTTPRKFRANPLTTKS